MSFKKIMNIYKIKRILNLKNKVYIFFAKEKHKRLSNCLKRIYKPIKIHKKMQKFEEFLEKYIKIMIKINKPFNHCLRLIM